MRKIAQMSLDDREALFRNSANKMRLTDAITEKDFWVCWMPDYLFHRCRWKSSFAFKGGTSLSKSYGLIERFSEDIDLILDWRILGYGKDEPWQERTNTKQDLFNKEANSRAATFIRDTFVPQIKQELSEELLQPIQCAIDENDNQTVKFSYLSSFCDNSILREIRLEIGALADDNLLASVVKFKDKFYHCPWAHYELAKRTTMRLMPPKYNMDKLCADYEHMQNMLFGEKPSFDEVIKGIEALQQEINAPNSQK